MLASLARGAGAFRVSFSYFCLLCFYVVSIAVVLDLSEGEWKLYRVGSWCIAVLHYEENRVRSYGWNSIEKRHLLYP